MNISKEMLKNIVSKIEHLEEEKASILEHIRDAYSEAKSQGFDAKVLKKVIKNRKIDRQKLLEEQDLIEVYTENLEG
ncbi:MAG: DUF2312 domain-containing protein [Cetobacterium sp.]